MKGRCVVVTFLILVGACSGSAPGQVVNRCYKEAVEAHPLPTAAPGAAADVQQMLDEIERGELPDLSPAEEARLRAEDERLLQSIGRARAAEADAWKRCMEEAGWYCTVEARTSQTYERSCVTTHEGESYRHENPFAATGEWPTPRTPSEPFGGR